MTTYRISYPPKIFVLSELYSQNRLSFIQEGKRQIYFDELLLFIEKLTDMQKGSSFTKTEVSEQLQAFTELKQYLTELWKIEKNIVEIEKVDFLKMIGMQN